MMIPVYGEVIRFDVPGAFGHVFKASFVNTGTDQPIAAVGHFDATFGIAGAYKFFYPVMSLRRNWQGVHMTHYLNSAIAEELKLLRRISRGDVGLSIGYGTTIADYGAAAAANVERARRRCDEGLPAVTMNQYPIREVSYVERPAQVVDRVRIRDAWRYD